MSTILTPAAISSGTFAAVTLCGSARSTTSQPFGRLASARGPRTRGRSAPSRFGCTAPSGSPTWSIDATRTSSTSGWMRSRAQHLAAAVAAAADDRCLESLRHRGPSDAIDLTVGFARWPIHSSSARWLRSDAPCRGASRADRAAGSRSTASPPTSTACNRVGDAAARRLRAARPRPPERVAGDGYGDHLVWRTPAWATDRRAASCSSATTTPCSRPAPSRAGTRQRRSPARPRRARHEGRPRRHPHGARRRSPTPASWRELPLAVVAVADEEIGSPDSADRCSQDLARGAARRPGLRVAAAPTT